MARALSIETNAAGRGGAGRGGGQRGWGWGGGCSIVHCYLRCSASASSQGRRPGWGWVGGVLPEMLRQRLLHTEGGGWGECA